MAALLTSMLKTGPQPAGALPANYIDNSKVVGNSGRNNIKLTKSDFTKLIHRAEEPSFLTPDSR